MRHLSITLNIKRDIRVTSFGYKGGLRPLRGGEVASQVRGVQLRWSPLTLTPHLGGMRLNTRFSIESHSVFNPSEAGGKGVRGDFVASHLGGRFATSKGFAPLEIKN